MNDIDPRLFRYIWRHSQREQLIILALILLQLPFFWLSLDLPKIIVNDGIQGGVFRDGQTLVRFFQFSLSLPGFLGGATYHISPGIVLQQLHYLLVLSFLFLLLTLINGAFRYFINLRKGVLGERMMRRLRFDLFTIMLCFRPEDIRSVKPAEISSMIKDEVEPIGGFIGDAFVQPAMLGSQALTALAFIMIQSLWLGLLAGAIVAAQALIIPLLRREQLRLGRERQLVSRQLAGRIGEIVDAAPAVQGHGVRGFSHAEISERLGRLFNIRVALYNRKFAVKYLNHLLSQITPFFFYSIGGFLALKGSLDIGQLVAVIAAYRELPSPIKELIDWDQQASDVKIKYEQIIAQFSPQSKIGPFESMPATLPSPESAIQFDEVKVAEGRASVLLDTLSITLNRPARIAVVGQPGSGRDIIMRALARQISTYSGKVTVGGTDLAQLSSENLGRLIGHVGPEPFLINATIRENILFSLNRSPPENDMKALTSDEMEAKRAGLPYWRVGADWVDYGAIGISGPEDLDQAIVRALRLSGAAEDVYRLGLERPLERKIDRAVEARIVAARQATRTRLEAEGLAGLIEFFDPQLFNNNATIAENLLFGLPVGEHLASTDLASDPYVRSILEAESLIDPLIDIGARMAEFALDMFASLPPAGALVERLSFIRAADLADYSLMVEAIRAPQGRLHLPFDWRFKLIALAMSYCSARHRMGLIDERLVERILRARKSFARFMPANYARHIEFYRQDRVIRRAPLRDNLLFGRVSSGIAHAETKVATFLRGILRDTGLEEHVYQIGLATPCGQSGRLLSPALRQAINLARSIIKQPQILIYEAAHISTNAHEKAPAIAAACPRTTIFVSLDEGADTKDYTVVLRFEGARMSAMTQSGINQVALDIETATG